MSPEGALIVLSPRPRQVPQPIHWTGAWAASVERTSKLTAPDCERLPLHPMPDRLLNVLWDEGLELVFPPFMIEIGLPGTAWRAKPLFERRLECGYRQILTVGANIINVMGTMRRVCRNVKRWRSAAMAMRWTAFSPACCQRYSCASGLPRNFVCQLTTHEQGSALPPTM